jgi:DNA repair exonuclease SbcCD ATPase subunit
MRPRKISSFLFVTLVLVLSQPSLVLGEDTCQSLNEDEKRLTDEVWKLQRDLNALNTKEKEKEMNDRQKIIDEQEKQIAELKAKKQGGYKNEIKLLKEDIAKSKAIIKKHRSAVKSFLDQINSTQKKLGQTQRKLEKNMCKKKEPCPPGELRNASGECQCDPKEMERLFPCPPGETCAGLPCGR